MLAPCALLRTPHGARSATCGVLRRDGEPHGRRQVCIKKPPAPRATLRNVGPLFGKSSLPFFLTLLKPPTVWRPHHGVGARWEGY